MTDDAAEVAGRRVDELLAKLRSGDERAAAVAEELTRCLVQFYGAGLARIVELIGAEQCTRLCTDPLVESLLLVHDLHPLDADTRIRAALDRIGAGEPQYLGIDAAGVVRVRLTGGASGCGSARQSARQDIEAAVRRAAPEATDVVVETPAAPPPLLQVSLRPGIARPPVVAGTPGSGAASP